MKTITLISALFLFVACYTASAAVITVSNNPVGAGQYTDVQTALNAANIGDTLYVMGSPFTYNSGGVNITKRITIIGAGYAVTGLQTNNLSTVIGTLSLDSVAFSTNPISGTNIIGVNTNITANFPFYNILISRCYCGSINTYDGNGWVIENCVINSTLDFYNYNSSSNAILNNIVRNNFILGQLYSNGQMIGSGLLVDHNIMENQISTINDATITNNIFFFANISASPNNANNVYNNNITVYATTDDLPFGTNTGTGNFNNLAPSTVFGSGLTASAGYPALLNDNWHLVAGSKGINAATDGTDIGIYGGSHPMPNFTGASTLPQITLFNIKNSSIPLNGTLNYEVKARQQN